MQFELRSPTINIQQSCDSWRDTIDKKIVNMQYLFKDVDLLEDLHRFGDLGPFDESFIEDLEWLHEVWLNDSEYSIDVYDNIMDRCTEIENKLAALPFEKAYCYREPEFHTKSNMEIVRSVFKENATWRFDPSTVKHYPIEERERIFTKFEYMCYFVINVREDLKFDLQTTL